MTQTPNGAEAQRIVDDLEEDIVDVDKASAGQSAPENRAAPENQAAPENRADPEQAQDEQDGQAEDVSGEVPGSPEPTD